MTFYSKRINFELATTQGVAYFLYNTIWNYSDGTWGAFIHVGENLLKDGRMGFLNKIILTPSHHRIHHAKNPLYMDTNFCNLLNIWDKVFKTYVNERKDIPIEYGITREMNPNSFIDANFGEFGALWKDIKMAPGLKNKLLYLVMSPGWHHTGNHKTTRIVKEEYFATLFNASVEPSKQIQPVNT